MPTFFETAKTMPTRAALRSHAEEVKHRSVGVVERSRVNCLTSIGLRYQCGQRIRVRTGPIYVMADSGLDQKVERAGVILVADDDASVSGSLRDILELAGHRVLVAGDGAAALQVLSEHEVDVLVLDMNMPVCDGWAVLRQLDDRSRPVVIVYSSAEFTPAEMREFYDTRPYGIIRKPSPPPYLLHAVDSAMAHLRAGDRDRVADERDRVADERDVVAEGRDVISGQRDRLVDQRERAADERDRLADEPERAGDRLQGLLQDRAPQIADPESPGEARERSGLIERAKAAISRSAALGEQTEAAKQWRRKVSKPDKPQ